MLQGWLIRLLLATLGFYVFESCLMEMTSERLSVDAWRNPLAFFECLWWLLPAVRINRILPHFVWKPIS